jgi:Protein of unknown function (DUF1588)
MTRINGSRLAALLGTLGLLGCSGRYTVGVDPASSGAGGSAVSAGGSIGNNEHPNAGGGDEAIVSTGGAASSAGAPALGYCGTVSAAPAGRPAPPFATPDEIWKRVQLFLDPSESSPAKLPAATTRQWAGDLAMSMLDALNNDSAPGMTRFVSSWLPGTPIASTWAAFFSVKGATLTDLLITNRVRNPGSGILTDDAVLSQGTATNQILITARGAVLRTELLCQEVPFPPAGVNPDPTAKPGQTRRQVLEQDLDLSAHLCATCHSLVDPLGYGLEHFDSVGTYSDIDNGSPIDSSGSIEMYAGTISFDGANQLGTKLAAQCEVAECLARRLLADAQGSAGLLMAPANPNTDVGQPDDVLPIAAAFAASNGDLRTLIREVVQSDAFLRAP